MMFFALPILAAVSSEARVGEVGAGMSTSWLDFDNDGKQDIYAADMWVAAGMRVLEDSHFHGLGVLLVQQQRYPEAEEEFKTCIEQEPDF